MISPAANEMLETLSQRSQQLTRQRFGKVIRLFAPLYHLSNRCINNCAYCGFSRDNAIYASTLSIEEVLREARALHEQGFLATSCSSRVNIGNLSPAITCAIASPRCMGKFPAYRLKSGLRIGRIPAHIVAGGADGLVFYQRNTTGNL